MSPIRLIDFSTILEHVSMIPGLNSYRKVRRSWPFFRFFVNNFWKNCAQNFKLRTDQAMPFNCCLTENHLKYDNLRMLTRPPFTRNWHISKWGEVGHPKNWRQLYCFKWQLIRRQFHCIIQKIECVFACLIAHTYLNYAQKSKYLYSF